MQGGAYFSGRDGPSQLWGFHSSMNHIFLLLIVLATLNVFTTLTLFSIVQVLCTSHLLCCYYEVYSYNYYNVVSLFSFII